VNRVAVVIREIIVEGERCRKIHSSAVSYPTRKKELITLSNPNVLVTAYPHPASKARRIMGAAVVGGAEASPKGFSNFIPQISTEMSTASISV